MGQVSNEENQSMSYNGGSASGRYVLRDHNCNPTSIKELRATYETSRSDEFDIQTHF